VALGNIFSLSKIVGSIDEKILGTEWFIKASDIITEPGIETTCEPCGNTCLYHNWFLVRIRGVKDNFYKEELWTEPVMFQFQCTGGEEKN
jgi:hypothetical protein